MSARPPTSTSSRGPKARAIDLALQGGGSHGAYTWGVLDRLLQDETISFKGVSGTSAGALNAAVMATGYHRGKREGAREALTEFWRDVSRSGSIFSPFSSTQSHTLADSFQLDRMPGYQWMSSFFRSFSPYEFNPMNLNPLRDVLRRHVQQKALHESSMSLFITATSVTTGQARVFTNKEVTTDVLLASACLPFIFQAVEIDGEPYWDGGYTGNPAIYPLIYNTDPLDILLIRINPLVRAGTPKRSEDIIDRVSEITFNASLMAEMRAIEFVSRLIREDKLDNNRYKDLRLHMVADDDGVGKLGASSKFNTDRAFLENLFELGRASADAWLSRHAGDIGVRSTVNIEREFLAPHRRRKNGN